MPNHWLYHGSKDQHFGLGVMVVVKLNLRGILLEARRDGDGVREYGI